MVLEKPADFIYDGIDFQQLSTQTEVADLMAKMTREEVEAIVQEAREQGQKPNLIGANLSEADLIGVDLRGANLNEVYLSGAYLHEADLSRADLSRADLISTYLLRANLSMATVSYTSFCGLDLRNVKGLETIRHRGPSYIDIQTLTLSQGQIPKVFLRGCGLNDAQIEMAKLYNPNLTSDEITLITYEIHRLLTDNPQIAHCFISYANSDQALAEKLYTDLQNNGVRCWYAPDKLKGGQKLKPQIDEAIRLYDVFLLILSEASMNSKWVKDEIAEAIGGKTLAKILGDKISKESRLFPIRLIDFEKIEAVWAGYGFGHEIREYYIPDFSQWQTPVAYQKSFERLLKDLRVSSSI